MGTKEESTWEAAQCEERQAFEPVIASNYISPCRPMGLSPWGSVLQPVLTQQELAVHRDRGLPFDF